MSATRSRRSSTSLSSYPGENLIVRNSAFLIRSARSRYLASTTISSLLGLTCDQVPLGGGPLLFGGNPAPEDGGESGVVHAAFHLVRGQPVNVELGAEPGGAPAPPEAAVAGLERGHQVTARLDHAGELGEGGRPIGWRQVHQRVPADDARQRGIRERKLAKVGDFVLAIGLFAPGHADHLGRQID